MDAHRQTGPVEFFILEEYSETMTPEAWEFLRQRVRDNPPDPERLSSSDGFWERRRKVVSISLGRCPNGRPT